MAEPYELYRVILDYEALQDGFLDRIDDLNTTLEQIDMSGGFAKGNVQKLLTKAGGNPKKERNANRPSDPTRNTPRSRKLGWESLGKMLKGTGLALVLVVDDERFAPLKEQLMQRQKPRAASVRTHTRPTWLFTRSKSLEMQVLRNQSLSPKQRKKIAKMAAKARWKRRRKISHPNPVA